MKTQRPRGRIGSTRLSLLAVTFAVVLVQPALAQEGIPEEAAEHGEAEHEHHRHHLALFAGGATNLDTDETGFAIGPAYRYRLSEQIGIETIAEVTFFPEETSYVLLAGLAFMPYRELVLISAPGLEVVHFDEPLLEGEGEDVEEVSSETAFVFRIGAGWEIPLGGAYALTPEIAFDFTDDATTFVWGVSFGIGF